MTNKTQHNNATWNIFAVVLLLVLCVILTIWGKTPDQRLGLVGFILVIRNSIKSNS